MTVQRPRHLPAHDLAGYRLTEHAFDRALERQVCPDDIIRAIREPEVRASEPGSGQRWRHVAAGLVVVLDPCTHRIITVYPQEDFA